MAAASAWRRIWPAAAAVLRSSRSWRRRFVSSSPAPGPWIMFMRSRRSDPSAVFPDRRNAMIVCKPVTPSPHFYSPVPALDRLRMSMPNSPCAMGRIRPKQGTSLDAMLRSNTNLATTLKDMQAKPPWTPATSRSPPSPSLVRMRTFTSPRSPDVMVGYAPDGGV